MSGYGNDTTGTITGMITWPNAAGTYQSAFPTSVTTTHYPTKHETMLNYVGLAMQALIARELSQIYTEEDIVERAWSMAEKLVAEAPKHGINLY